MSWVLDYPSETFRVLKDKESANTANTAPAASCLKPGIDLSVERNYRSAWMNLFCSLDDSRIADAIRGAKRRVLLCTSGFGDPVAAALIDRAAAIGRDNVRVVVDGTDIAARSGYGHFDAIAQAHSEGVEICKEPGLRLSVLIADEEGYCFALPPLLVEDVAENAVTPNAVRLSQDQIAAIVEAVAPTPVPTLAGAVAPVRPQIGESPLSAREVAEITERLEANPPQKFDLARKVTIFNAYVEFVEIELTGTQIDRHRVQLPRDLLLATSDEATRKRLSASFELIRDTSALKREADALRKKVDAVRREMTRPLGKRYGVVMLRAHRNELERRIEALRVEVEKFKASVKQRLEHEVTVARDQLVKSLLPLIRRNPPNELRYSVTRRLTNEAIEGISLESLTGCSRSLKRSSAKWRPRAPSRASHTRR